MSEKIFLVLINLSGEREHYISGQGNLNGCLSEAAALRKAFRGERFVAMGPGDWESNDVSVQVVELTKHLYELWGWANLGELKKQLKINKARKK